MGWIDIVIERKYDRKKQNRNNNLIGFMFLILIFILISLIIYCSSWYAYRGPTSIDYSRLNEFETEYAHNLMSQIDEEFILASKSIMFTRNLSDFKKNKNDSEGFYIGENWLIAKQIKVYLTMNDEYDSNTLRHELLHSLVINKNDEYFVKEMANKGMGLR